MKVCEMLKRKDVGSIGIGAMIVFIAMVLVAGIAASVLIQTSTKLETQAMKSGQETIGEVSGGIAVFDITGKKATSDLGNLSVTVRTRAGSPNIDLNHTVVMMSDGAQKAVLVYNGHNSQGSNWTTHYNSSVDADGDLFGTGNWSDLTYETFGIIVLEDADSSCTRFTPVINAGDKVVLKIRCGSTGTGCFGRELPERTDVFGQVMPEIGSPGIISFTTPAAYSDTVFDLQ